MPASEPNAESGKQNAEIIPSPRRDVPPAAVARAERRLLALPQVDCPLRHVFSEGVCVREVTMPAGALVIGHAHRFADLNIMLTGRLTLLREDGTLQELRAPQTFVGTPGRKIAYIHETVIWQNVWPVIGQDIESIEEHWLDKSPEWVADREQRLALERLAREPDREDFARFLARYELPAEDVRRISETTADLVAFQISNLKFQIGESAIEGKGLIATSPIAAGEVIAPARIGGKRTPAGRYANHAQEPNAEMRRTPAGDMELVARRDIRGCAGGQPGEEITVNYEQVLSVNRVLVIQNAKTKGKSLCQP